MHASQLSVPKGLFRLNIRADTQAEPSARQNCARRPRVQLCPCCASRAGGSSRAQGPCHGSCMGLSTPQLSLQALSDSLCPDAACLASLMLIPSQHTQHALCPTGEAPADLFPGSLQKQVYGNIFPLEQVKLQDQITDDTLIPGMPSHTGTPILQELRNASTCFFLFF